MKALLAALGGLFALVGLLIRRLVRAKSAQAVAEHRTDTLEANQEANDAAKIHLDHPPKTLVGRRARARRMREARAAELRSATEAADHGRGD